MSIIKTTRIWNGLPIEEYTNTDTGVTELRSASFLGSQGDLLATGDGKGKWSYNDKAGFRRRYNNKQRTQGKPTLPKEEFDRVFFTEGRKLFDNDRAAVLNNADNYGSIEEMVRNQISFAKNNLPGVINPDTGKKNNSQGTDTQNPNNNDVDESTSSFELSSISEITTGSSSSQNLRYPVGQIPDLGYDYVLFTAHEYKAAAIGDSEFKGITTSSGQERLGDPLERISLPILPGREESNSVGFGEDSMNGLQAAAARVAVTGLAGAAEGDILGAVKNMASMGSEEIRKLYDGRDDIKTALVAYFAGQAVGSPGFVTRATGSVLNPNMELLFKGPSMRTFSFSFQFRPRFPDEAVAIKEIIRIFKRNMAVQRSSTELFLSTPNIFTIKYISGGDSDPLDDGHPFMNRFKPCMLSGFTVNYTPDSNYMTYDDGSMTGYDVGMTFQEIVPIYADEQANAGGTGF